MSPVTLYAFFIGLFLGLPEDTSAIEIETCNCSTPSTKISGILKDVDDTCELKLVLLDQTKQQRVEYEVFSYRHEKNFFTGYSCAAILKSFQNYHYFSGTMVETRFSIAIQVAASECFKWVQTMLQHKEPDCFGNKMRRAPTSNVLWGYNSETPRELPAWLGVRVEQQRACTLEIVSMTKECGTCPIRSKFGLVDNPINLVSLEEENRTNNPNEEKLWSSGAWQYYVMRDNIIIWDGGDVQGKNCTRHSVEKGVGNLTVTDKENVSRLVDPVNELDFMLSSVVPSDDTCFEKNVSTHVILGKQGIHIKVKSVSASKRNTQSDVDLSGHLQFIQNSAIDQENKLLKNIRHNFCDNQRNRLHQAIGVAQYNGWLGAAMLQLPYCTRLIPTALSAFVQECQSEKINFETTRDKCGAKPTWNNFTISVNGKELTKDEECYWKGSIVAMGNETYTLINNNWTVLQPNYEIKIDQKSEKLSYVVDNAMDHIFSRGLDADDFVASHMYAVADLMAIVSAHDNDPTIGRPHISSAILKRKEVENHSFLHTAATWFKYCGWLVLLGGGAFLIFRLFGGRSIISKGLGLCGVPSWISSLLSCNIGNLLGNKKKPEHIQLQTPTTTIINMPHSGHQVNEETSMIEIEKPMASDRRVRRSSRRRRRSAE